MHCQVPFTVFRTENVKLPHTPYPLSAPFN